MDSVTITFKLEAGFGNMMQLQLILNTTHGPVALPWTNTPDWQAPGTYTHTFNLPGQIDPKQVGSIAVIFQSFHSGGLGGFGGSATFFASDIEVIYHAVGYPEPFSLAALHTPTQIRNVLEMQATAELPPYEGLNPCLEASCCVQKLLGHLNCHKRYYNSIVWLNEDPNERIMRWSCCGDGQPSANLIAQIENTPITVYGDFVVFGLVESPLVDDPDVLPVTKIVTMPTPGVYGEGILGQCDTCEIIDPDRRWDWKDSPCPDNAPTVDSPPAPQTGVQVSDLKLDAITKLISFLDIPTTPESGLKEVIAALLENADKGSAASKALLEKLMAAIKDSIPKSTGLPQTPKPE